MLGQVGPRGIEEGLQDAQVDLKQGRAAEDPVVTAQYDQRIESDVVFRVGRDAVHPLLVRTQRIDCHYAESGETVGMGFMYCRS